jgi:transketolase
MESSITTSASAAAMAKRIRQRVLEMICRAKSSHIGSVFSATDILAVLYDHVLRIDPARPDWPDRDRFILSKGHACAGLYAALAERGFIPASWLD